ncbi:MAG: hypothetical protein IPP73_19870 [Chitinophagaceae bacterium]|nr:hypothetical protein [Chitinophagaceae bacterium]
MKLRSLVLLLIIPFVSHAQLLNSFTLNMHADSLSYLSIKNKKAYTTAEAGAVKADLDLGLFGTPSGKLIVTEWYNLKPDNEKVPAALTGTTTKIVALSFDRDQFDKCKTAADLKRMTGYLTTNSFSHFAVIRNSSEYYQRCFIVETMDGKRGLLFVTDTVNGQLKVEMKME